MSRTRSWIWDSSTLLAPPPSTASAVALPSRARSLLMSSAKLSSSTSPTVAPMDMSARAMPRGSCSARATLSMSTPLETAGGRRPTMPKSRKPTRPSSSTRRLPACTSAWKNSHFCTERAQVLSAATRVISGSLVYRLMPSRSTSGTPRSRDMVRTFVETRSKTGTGTVTEFPSPFSSMNSRKTTRFRASSLKSSSPSIEARRSETMSESEPRVLSSGLMKPSTRAAM
mmetsp:Transcript_21714/g.64675  ORF Transcript_21714/g.64675 Transcript_21714/m.64675 type:complete len:228 (+) Transcript_21714:216-899(+)